MGRLVLVVVVTAQALLMQLAATVQADARPWKPREPRVKPSSAHQLRNPALWPEEPSTPPQIDPARFNETIVHLCGPRRAGGALGVTLLATAEREAVDPFLLASLMFDRSRCHARHSSRRTGHGLLGIDPRLVLRPGAPRPVERRLLSPRRLQDPAVNLEVGARLMRMWEETHEEIDDTFGGVRHRSPVSHLIWGDVVRSSGSEDLILATRRRLIAHYLGQVDLPRPSARGVALVPPLEGAPRVATSGPGDDREGGARRHGGLDIAATEGEPVRSIADGVVIFAGVSLRSNSRKGPISPRRISRYKRRRLGVGGIYLCIRHAPLPPAAITPGAPSPAGDKNDDGVVSCYMHLDSYVVAKHQRVQAGELIGYVGRTGVRSSPSHLHLEIRVNDRKKNPLVYFSDVLIPPRATLTWSYVRKAKRARLRAARMTSPAVSQEL